MAINWDDQENRTPSYDDVFYRPDVLKAPMPPRTDVPTIPPPDTSDPGDPRGDYQGWFNRITTGKTPDSATLIALEPTLKKYGMSIAYNAKGIAHKIKLPDGRIVRVGNYFDSDPSEGFSKSWGWVGGGGPSGGGPSSGTGGTTTGVPGVDTPSYMAQFDDPSTRPFEDLLNFRVNELKQPLNDPSRDALARLLDQQTGYFQSQRTAQEAENAKLKARQGQAQLSADDLIKYMNERIGTLKQPAYTGTEAEVLRTRALDPIEADRQAARQRALGRVSQSGMDLSSGISQQLLNDTDASFDRARAGAQNELAYKQIQEERSRQQEAQALLASIPQIQRAGAAGDLDFLQQLDAAMNRAQGGAIATAGQSAALGQTTRDEEQSRRQEMISLASMLQQLPTNAAQQGLAAFGMAGNPESLLQAAIQLYGLGQNQRQQGVGWYESLGAMLPYLAGGFGGGGNGLPGFSSTPRM